ncbi:glutamate-rich WD repeat-containing protein 1 [Tanacetum coccineum]|uniref:Glutamate-rich WD repeat-containing protein 1 n=1 Tax=Tanacetum coccineum TaxID=301880 RepID=A0ABQ5HR78_9ASTR
MNFYHLASQLEFILEWIQSQPKPKTRETPLKEKFEDRASLKCHTKEYPDNETHVILPRGSHKPFKVEARIDIPSYDGTVDAKKLDSWIDQLETYFNLYGLSKIEKRRKSHGMISNEIYSKTFFLWDIHKTDVMLGISITYEDVFTKYVAGLQWQIQNELRMYSFEDISSASRIAMAIEVKNKNGGLKIEQDVKEHMAMLKKSVGKHIPNCFQKMVEEVDKILTLMMKPTAKVMKEKQELFTLKIQVKQEVIEAIVDTGSEKNLISSSLVEWLGLKITPHPRPYSLGWIKKYFDTQVNR